MRAFLIALTSLSVLVACNRDGRDYVPGPVDGFPGIAILNEGEDVEVIPQEQWVDGAVRPVSAIYHTLGTPTSGYFGGSTLTFMGTGGDVCVIVDPESVWWNQSVAASGANSTWAYADNYLDDGDMDLEVGLSAYYTGSPGLEMGTFEQPYEDSLGNMVTIEFNECVLVGSRSQVGAHAGRARPEYCTIDTSLHPDRQYTVALTTWSVPKDDYLISYAVAVFDGACDDTFEVGANNRIPLLDPAQLGDVECALLGESRDEDGNIRAGFDDLELAFCAGEQAEYCEANPGMCG
ncbi:MAG: hypothetical protein H6741_22640 [Alphaproteobacteria bacterium]|nr:hypothetical protein [Alphaproteobacteria bacterium]